MVSERFASLHSAILFCQNQQFATHSISVLVAIVNGFVVYAAAVGVNNVGTSRPGAVAPPAPGAGRSLRWWP